jgi:hypothetical protein
VPQPSPEILQFTNGSIEEKSRGKLSWSVLKLHVSTVTILNRPLRKPELSPSDHTIKIGSRNEINTDWRIAHYDLILIKGCKKFLRAESFGHGLHRKFVQIIQGVSAKTFEPNNSVILQVTHNSHLYENQDFNVLKITFKTDIDN